MQSVLTYRKATGESFLKVFGLRSEHVFVCIDLFLSTELDEDVRGKAVVEETAVK